MFRSALFAPAAAIFGGIQMLRAVRPWLEAPRRAARPALQRARAQLMGVLDRTAATAFRLAVLGAVVWCGTSIVTHVTTVLQGASGAVTTAEAAVTR